MKKERSFARILADGYKPVNSQASHGMLGRSPSLRYAEVDCSEWTPDQVRDFLCKNLPFLRGSALDPVVKAAIQDGVIKGHFTFFPKWPSTRAVASKHSVSCEGWRISEIRAYVRRKWPDLKGKHLKSFVFDSLNSKVIRPPSQRVG